MPRSKEIIVLLVLLLGAMAFVLWYVIDRRAKNRANERADRPRAAISSSSTPEQPEVALGTPMTERKTIDFTSGQPVVKDTPEERAAIDAALKDMAEAAKEVTFAPASPPAGEKSPP
jgi:hypothetical protein